MSEFINGDIVYYNNEQAKFISYLTDHTALLSFYRSEGDEEEYYFETDITLPCIVSQISTEKINLFANQEAKRNDLSKAINEKSQELRDIQKEINEHDVQLEARKKKHTELQLLFDFLDDKVTHFVVKRYSGIEIVSFLDMMKPSDYKEEDEYYREENHYRNRQEFKLLSLFGKADKDMYWNIAHYNDGSGGGSSAYPFTSYDDALQKVTEMIQEQVESVESVSVHNRGNLIKNADKFGVTSDKIEEIRVEFKKYNEENRQKRIAEKKEEIAKLEAEN